MATEKDFELLDDYLTNRLNDQEKFTFKQKLEADPDLANEYKIQQHVIQSIRNVRAAELKTMLKNIPVAPAQPGLQTSIVKLAVGTFLAGVVATGTYLYFHQDKDQQIATEQVGPAVEPSVKHDQNVASQNTHVQKQQPIEEKTSAIANNKSEVEVNEEQPLQQQEAPKRKPVEVFDPSETDTGSVTAVEEQVSTPGKTDKKGPSITVEIDRQNKKYNFHYQFKDDKLFLYGPFEKNVYEIMEFFSEEKRTMFLYHKNEYYLLSEDNNKIKSLAAISDPVLLKKLKESRGN